MSFGFSIGDFNLLTNLARHTVDNAREACGAHDSLTREVNSLHVVLQRLQLEVSKPDSILNHTEDNRRKELGTLARDCRRVLNVLSSVLEKYNALSEEKRSVTKLWKQIRFGNGEMQDIGNIRMELSTYTQAITLFLNLLAMGELGKVGRYMETHGEELREIRHSLHWVVATAQAKSHEEKSILTSYTEDDKGVWKEFRRELIREGFSSKTLGRYKKTIKSYVLELGERGALDEIEACHATTLLKEVVKEGPSQASSPTAIERDGQSVAASTSDLSEVASDEESVMGENQMPSNIEISDTKITPKPSPTRKPGGSITHRAVPLEDTHSEDSGNEAGEEEEGCTNGEVIQSGDESQAEDFETEKPEQRVQIIAELQNEGGSCRSTQLEKSRTIGNLDSPKVPLTKPNTTSNPPMPRYPSTYHQPSVASEEDPDFLPGAHPNCITEESEESQSDSSNKTPELVAATSLKQTTTPLSFTKRLPQKVKNRRRDRPARLRSRGGPGANEGNEAESSRLISLDKNRENRKPPNYASDAVVSPGSSETTNYNRHANRKSKAPEESLEGSSEGDSETDASYDRYIRLNTDLQEYRNEPPRSLGTFMKSSSSFKAGDKHGRGRRKSQPPECLSESMVQFQLDGIPPSVDDEDMYRSQERSPLSRSAHSVGRYNSKDENFLIASCLMSPRRARRYFFDIADQLDMSLFEYQLSRVGRGSPFGRYRLPEGDGRDAEWGSASDRDDCSTKDQPGASKHYKSPGAMEHLSRKENISRTESDTQDPTSSSSSVSSELVFFGSGTDAGMTDDDDDLTWYEWLQTHPGIQYLDRNNKGLSFKKRTAPANNSAFIMPRKLSQNGTPSVSDFDWVNSTATASSDLWTEFKLTRDDPEVNRITLMRERDYKLKTFQRLS
ncbi:hypothetical protein IFR05_006118 [Cadophora sp. M221]|nr:hypothetical protein IFR05_006118 [Cadophora sp. M221]